jgi:hypothetical protein
MANPNKYGANSDQPSSVSQHVSFTVGSSGAVGTLTKNTGPEVKSVTGPANTSDYTVNLREGWVRARNIRVWFVGAYDATQGTNSKVIADNVAATSSPGFTFTVARPDTGAAALPATSDVCHITFDLDAV